MALDYIEKYDGAKTNPFKPVRSQLTVWDTVLIYENLNEPNWGLLKKENLIKIREIESIIVNDPRWKNLCYAQDKDN